MVEIKYIESKASYRSGSKLIEENTDAPEVPTS